MHQPARFDYLNAPLALFFMLVGFGLPSFHAVGAINPFEFKKTAPICILATIADVESREAANHTQLIYQVNVDAVIRDETGLTPTNTPRNLPRPRNT